MLKKVAVLGMLLAASQAAAQQTNLGFEVQSSDDPHRPAGWKVSGAGYEIALDSLALEGKRSLRLIRARPGGFAGASQTVSTVGLNATRVRLSGYVRTVDVTGGAAGFAMLVWGSGPRPIYVESITDAALPQWTRYDLELPVPSGATRVEFGAQFTGSGTAWFDAVSLEMVNDTAVSDTVRAYVAHALDLMEKNSLRRDSIDWQAFRAEAWQLVRGTRRVAALHPVLESLVTRLGDHHSHFVRPRKAATIGSTPKMPSGSLVAERIGYLHVPEFGVADSKQLKAYADTLNRLLRELDRHGVCGWIVDLRNNSGGNMWPMIAGLGPLSGSGTLGWFVRADGKRDAWGYKDGASRHRGAARVNVSGAAHKLRIPNPPVAIITNGRTASSGEVVAVAFRGRPRTRSFGTPTTGQSTGNETFELADGAKLVITTTVLADRTGKQYGGPIIPEVVLPASNAAAPSDSTATAAREWLESLPQCKGSARGPSR